MPRPGTTITNKVYVGVSKQPSVRLQQHCRSPPARMLPDLATLCTTLKDAVQQPEIVCWCDDTTSAHRIEAALIRAYDATKAGGYNKLPRNPGHSPQFWAARARRAAQQN
jgi:hypothetical protein